MVRPISTDLRERLICAVERDGILARTAAARFAVPLSSAIKCVRRYPDVSSVTPNRIGGYNPWLLEGPQSDLTLRGLAAELAERA